MNEFFSKSIGNKEKNYRKRLVSFLNLNYVKVINSLLTIHNHNYIIITKNICAISDALLVLPIIYIRLKRFIS